MRSASDEGYVEYVEARLPALKRLAYLLCGDDHRADDLVQESIVKLYVKWSTASRADNLDAYARAIVVRTHIDNGRRPWSRVSLFGQAPDQRGEPDRDRSDRYLLHDALGRLPAGQRAVLVLRYLCDLSIDEVAGNLGCSPGTVKSQSAHGLKNVAAAVLTGRRRRRHRRWRQTGLATLGVAGVVVAIAVAPLALHSPVPAPDPLASATHRPTPSPPVSSPPTQVSCTEQLLATLTPGQKSLVTGADPTGRYLVGRLYGTNGWPSKLAIWDNGALRAVTMPGDDPAFYGVNSSGVAVGTSYLAGTDNEVSWIYSAGRVTRLTGSAGDKAQAINNRGVIVGGWSNGTLARPLLWSSPTATPQALSLPDGWIGGASDVDEDGTVVGSGSRPGTAPTALVWAPDGTRTAIPLPNIAGVTGMGALSIRDGVVLTVASGPISQGSATGTWSHHLLYTLATGTFSDPFDKYGALASNSHGWGVSSGPSLWIPGTGQITLPELPGGGGTDTALTISDDGHVIGGQDTDTADVIHAVTWHCR